jgi:hypothetical protein
VRSNLEVFSKGSVLTAHDWLRVVQDAGDYLFHDLYPDKPEKMEALYALIQATKLCLTATSACDSENRSQLDRIQVEVTEALCKFECQLPKTERAVMFHILVHVPDAIYRWNSTRNFWCFFGERY